MKALQQSIKVLKGNLGQLKTRANEIISSKTKLSTLVIVFVLSALAGWLVSSKIVVSTSESLDRRVFVKVAPEELKTGSYVMIQTDPKDPFAKGKLVSKKIGCSSGEILEIKNDEYFCEGYYLGKAKKVSRSGIPVSSFYPCDSSEVCRYQLKEGEYFVIGTHKDSYDSRYFGPIKRDVIIARLLPLW